MVITGNGMSFSYDPKERERIEKEIFFRNNVCHDDASYCVSESVKSKREKRRKQAPGGRNLQKLWAEGGPVKLFSPSGDRAFTLIFNNYKHLKYEELDKMFSSFGEYLSIRELDNDYMRVRYETEEEIRKCYNALIEDDHYEVTVLLDVEEYKLMKRKQRGKNIKGSSTNIVTNNLKTSVVGDNMNGSAIHGEEEKLAVLDDKKKLKPDKVAELLALEEAVKYNPKPVLKHAHDDVECKNAKHLSKPRCGLWKGQLVIESDDVYVNKFLSRPSNLVSHVTSTDEFVKRSGEEDSKGVISGGYKKSCFKPEDNLTFLKQSFDEKDKNCISSKSTKFDEQSVSSGDTPAAGVSLNVSHSNLSNFSLRQHDNISSVNEWYDSQLKNHVSCQGKVSCGNSHRLAKNSSSRKSGFFLSKQNNNECILPSECNEIKEDSLNKSENNEEGIIHHQVPDHSTLSSLRKKIRFPRTKGLTRSESKRSLVRDVEEPLGYDASTKLLEENEKYNSGHLKRKNLHEFSETSFYLNSDSDSFELGFSVDGGSTLSEEECLVFSAIQSKPTKSSSSSSYSSENQTRSCTDSNFSSTNDDSSLGEEIFDNMPPLLSIFDLYAIWLRTCVLNELKNLSN